LLNLEGKILHSSNAFITGAFTRHHIQLNTVSVTAGDLPAERKHQQEVIYREAAKKLML
jgi:hypothetical protein